MLFILFLNAMGFYMMCIFMGLISMWCSIFLMYLSSLSTLIHFVRMSFAFYSEDVPICASSFVGCSRPQSTEEFSCYLKSHSKVMALIPIYLHNIFLVDQLMMYPLYKASWILCLSIRLSLIVFICVCYDYIVLISIICFETQY